MQAAPSRRLEVSRNFRERRAKQLEALENSVDSLICENQQIKEYTRLLEKVYE